MHSFYMLKVDYDDDIHWLGEIYDIKEKLMKKIGGLREFIKIYRDRVDP
jgi:hypothetical protein